MLRLPLRTVSYVATLPLALGPSQRSRETHLTRPEFVAPTENLSIAGFRELSSRFALVVDGVGGVLLRLDMEAGRLDTLGRRGTAFGEYQSPDCLVPMPNGGTLLADLGGLRLWLLGPDGKATEGYPMVVKLGAREVVVVPKAADARGRIYFDIPKHAGGMSDSLLVLRLDLKRPKTDTVASVKALEMRVSPPGTGGGGASLPRQVAFGVTDAWAVAPDGRVVVARATGPRLEWISAARGVVKGPVVTFSPIQVTDSDKSAFADRFSRTALIVTTEGRNGVVTRRVRRGMDRVSLSWFMWPDRKAPFDQDGLHVSPTGEAWLERAVASGESKSVDVFGPDAVWRRRIILPRGRSIIGFGAGVVYLQKLSPSGKVTLERYRLSDG